MTASPANTLRVKTGTPRSSAAAPLLWFGGLLLVCYAPVLLALVRQWNNDEDMSHGFFVPLIAGYITWQKRERLRLTPVKTNWWGLALIIFAALQLWIATLGAELFLARTAFIFSIIGIVLFLGGTAYIRELAFPLMLLFLMIPIPAILYNRITFPLQILASKAAKESLMLLQIPVLREGNVLQLPDRALSVVEACSGIRSLLSLTFLALVYGYFFDSRNSIRIALVAATAPIAIAANALRVTLTGVLTEIKPELAEGFFHSASGWVIFMIALLILMAFHHLLKTGSRWIHASD